MLYNNALAHLETSAVRPGRLTDFTRKLDQTAVALSGLCLVHCLLLPVLLALFPLIGFDFMGHETFHQLILIVVVPTTAAALGVGCWRHRSGLVALLGTAGVAALIVAAFAVHAMGTLELERGVTVAGGLLLAAAHIRNFQLARHRHRGTHGPVAVSRGG